MSAPLEISLRRAFSSPLPVLAEYTAGHPFDSSLIPREIVNTDFEKINDLRNIVFHFRRGITPKNTDRLRRFRDKLRYNREMYTKRAAARFRDA
jgi:hypothetical protein